MPTPQNHPTTIEEYKAKGEAWLRNRIAYLRGFANHANKAIAENCNTALTDLGKKTEDLGLLTSLDHVDPKAKKTGTTPAETSETAKLNETGATGAASTTEAKPGPGEPEKGKTSVEMKVDSKPDRPQETLPSAAKK